MGSFNLPLQAITAKLADKMPWVVGRRKASVQGSFMADVTWAKLHHFLLKEKQRFLKRLDCE